MDYGKDENLEWSKLQGSIKRMTSSYWPCIMVGPGGGIKWFLTLYCPIFHVYGWGLGKQLTLYPIRWYLVTAFRNRDFF
jgi:hypothetical protein